MNEVSKTKESAKRWDCLAVQPVAGEERRSTLGGYTKQSRVFVRFPIRNAKHDILRFFVLLPRDRLFAKQSLNI